MRIVNKRFDKVDSLKKKFARSEWEQKSVQFDPTQRAQVGQVETSKTSKISK